MKEGTNAMEITLQAQIDNLTRALKIAHPQFTIPARIAAALDDALVDGLDHEEQRYRLKSVAHDLRVAEDTLRAVFGVWGPGREAGVEAQVAALHGPVFTALRYGVDAAAEWLEAFNHPGEEFDPVFFDTHAKVAEFVETARLLRRAGR